MCGEFISTIRGFGVEMIGNGEGLKSFNDCKGLNMISVLGLIFRRIFDWILVYFGTRCTWLSPPIAQFRKSRQIVFSILLHMDRSSVQ